MARVSGKSMEPEAASATSSASSTSCGTESEEASHEHLYRACAQCLSPGPHDPGDPRREAAGGIVRRQPGDAPYPRG